MARFYESPATVARLAARFGGCTPAAVYTSWYGETRGWRSPNQGWSIWNRWFRTDTDYIDPEEIAPATLGAIRNTLAAVQESFDAPFVNKWQRNSARVEALARVFPEALFIWMKRRPEMVAQSILHGRREFLHDEGGWLSVAPRHVDSIKGHSPLRQVCDQVHYLEEDIREYVAHVGAQRVLTVHYEEMCQDPRKCLADIQDFYDRAGVAGRLAARRDVPERFDLRDNVKIGKDEFEEIRRYFSRSPGADGLE